jgi:hypothetical protein
MAKVAHPAVIIGLGGTGKWILTYIKKSLMDTYGGVVPPTIQLLSFDTTSEKVSHDGNAQEEDVQVGDLQLDSNSEFVYLGGNIKQIALDIHNRNEYPHIGSWLQAGTYLQSTDDRSFDISDGAGQKRPFGRMSLFLDLQSNVEAKISNKISTAITNVINANRQVETVEIYIIGSLAGGTGAGTFIDVAHLARWYAMKKLATGKFAIRGFLVLPNSFQSVIQVGKVQAQAFAAMRELDRFMYVFNQSYPIVYNPYNAELQTSYGGSESGKLFDSCFMLDANRELVSLEGVPPKYGVYPTIADAINMLLDGSVGESFVQHYINVGNDIALTQSRLKKPIYSSLGAFAMILPVEDIITSLSYRFARELLADHLLQLREEPSEGGQTRYSLIYEGNAREEAISFLRMPQSASGIASTAFIQRVPDLERVQRKDITVIGPAGDQEAAELLTWIIPPEGDPSVEALIKQVRDDLQMRLVNQVNTSDIEGDDPIDGAGRIVSRVRDFREEYLGREVGGRKVGGRYQKALERCRDLHRERYRRLLIEYMNSLLNGPAPTNLAFQAEKQGRLGRAQAFLANLVFLNSELVAFFDDIKAYRAKQGYNAQAYDEASLLRTEMDDHKSNSSGFLGIGRILKDMSPAIKAQKAYLDAEQNFIDVEVSDLFFDYLQQTARLLQRESEEFKTEIDNWVNSMVHGVTGSIYDQGLYRALNHLTIHHQTEREQKQTNFQQVRQYLTDAQYEDRIYQTQVDGKFPEALTRFIWNVSEQNGVVSVDLNGYTSVQKAKRTGQTERNLEQLLSLARPYFEPLRNTLAIRDRLVELYEPDRLARYLRDSSAAMARFVASDKAGGDTATTYFICVNAGDQIRYFNNLGAQLSNFGSSNYQNQILESDNPYTCTVLVTTDRFASGGLFSYVTAEREYNQYTGDARLLHIFPAEVNAVHLEQQLRTINEPRRRFSLRLTATLEDLHLVRLFMQAYLYRFIRPDAVDNRTSRWNLYLKTDTRRGNSVIALSQPSPSLDLLDALETFAFKKADIVNSTISIDFKALAKALEEREEQASGGDTSRLINMLEELIELEVEPMRNGSDQDQNMRDLGSVMRLLLDERIHTLRERLKHRGQTFDSTKAPLINIRAIDGGEGVPVSAPALAPVASQPVPAVAPASQPINGNGAATHVVSSTAVAPDLAGLRRDFDRLQSGKLTMNGFAKRLEKVIQNGQLSELQLDLEDYLNGDLTEDGFKEVLEDTFAKL